MQDTSVEIQDQASRGDGDHTNKRIQAKLVFCPFELQQGHWVYNVILHIKKSDRS